MFSNIQVLKCFLCACVANDAGHFVTGGPPQELGVKRLVFYKEAAHTNECFISCDGHYLYTFKGLVADLEVHCVRYNNNKINLYHTPE